MSAIFGIVKTNGTSIDDGLGNEILDVMNHWDADSCNIRTGDSSILGHLLLLNSPQSKWENQPFFDTESRFSITADATLFNRPELFTKLNIDPKTAIPDSELILSSFKKWGKDCPNHLNGGFAFAIWDENNRELFCARDHHGIKPFYFFHNSDYFGFASEIKGLLKMPFVSKELDELWIADFLCRIWLDRTSTLYKSIKRLEPSQSITINANGIQISTYWEPIGAEKLKLNSDEEYIEAFKAKLHQSIERRTSNSYGISSELSGGLDSSAVTTIGHQSRKDIKPYSYVFPKDFSHPNLYDERKEIELILDYAGIKQHEMLTDQGIGIMNAIEWNERIHDEPPKEMNCLFRENLYGHLAKSNTRVLLSGFGGDDMVSSHGSGYLEELVKTGRWKLAWNEIVTSEKSKNLDILTKTASLTLKGLLGFNPERYNNFLRRYFPSSHGLVREKLHLRPIQKELFDRVDMEERFMAYQRRYLRTGNFNIDQVRRMQQPHVMFRLELCDIATRSFKIEYRYPLLDIELIELYLSLPMHMKVRNGKGRYIFRKAVEDVLPPEIIWRESKKGSSNPHIAQRNQVDGKTIVEGLKSISPSHPICQYADFGKTISIDKIKINGQERAWYQQTTHVMNLLLARKIETIL